MPLVTRHDSPLSTLHSPLITSAWLGVVFGYLYVELMTLPSLERRRELLGQILRHEAKSDYLYATYTLAQLQHFITTHTPLNDTRAFALIDFAGILFLFSSAGWFLHGSFATSTSRLAGLLWLAVSSPLLLFRHHYYHPSDFYATGLMFSILLAAKHGRFVQLALLCLVSGVLWEKTLFVPFLYLVWESARVGWPRGSVRALPALVTTLLCFAGWRLAFPGERVYAFATWAEFLRTLPLAGVEWFVCFGPIVVMLAQVVLTRRRVDPFWLLWLLYIPLLAGVIFAVRGQMRELRSFWICQPILTGFVASWTAARQSRPE